MLIHVAQGYIPSNTLPLSRAFDLSFRGRLSRWSFCVCVQTISQKCLDTIRDWTPKLAKALNVIGLINIQYCVQDDEVGFPWQNGTLSWRHCPRFPGLPCVRMPQEKGEFIDCTMGCAHCLSLSL
jgi:hypothetical protein